MPKNLYFSQDEYERRWKAVYDSMAEKGYETAVIWGKTAGNYERHGDLLYLTNYYSNQSGHSLDVEGHQQAPFLRRGHPPPGPGARAHHGHAQLRHGPARRR